jgi:hypothetical protein
MSGSDLPLKGAATANTADSLLKCAQKDGKRRKTNADHKKLRAWDMTPPHRPGRTA